MSNPAAKHPLFRGHLAAALVCAAAALVLFQFFGNATRGYVRSASLFWWWVSQWLDPRAESEHGWLILALSAGLLVRNLRAADRGARDTTAADAGAGLRKTDSQRPAALAMAAGLGLHAMGFVAQQSRVSIVGLLVFAWGVVRLAGGRRWGAAAMFPLGFLAFAIPINVLDEVGLPMRLWVTTAGERLAHLAGIAVVRSGTQLVAPDGHFNYDVAAPCSGVRSLMALAALTLLVAYVNFRSVWRRALLVALCFPLVYLGNVVRIVVIVFAAQWAGPAWGERAHAVMGYGVFVIVLGGVLAAVGVLRRKWPERDIGSVTVTAAERETAREPEPAFVRKTWSEARGAAWVAAAIAVLVGGEVVLLGRIARLPPRGEVGVVLAADGRDPVELPAFLGTEWIGRRVEVSAVEREILPADTGFSRKIYASVADRRQDVFLSIVLSGRDRTSIHRPELCLVGQGWTVEGAARHAFRFPAAAGDEAPRFPATVLRVRREVPTPRGKVVVPQIVAYWFVGGRTIVSSHLQRFLHDAWNRVAHARADRWAYVLMQTDAADGEAAALARMQSVLDATLPVFQRPPER